MKVPACPGDVPNVGVPSNYNIQIPVPALRKGILLARNSPRVPWIMRRERITDKHEKDFVADQGWPIRFTSVCS
jgi:hypothetical protein